MVEGDYKKIIPLPSFLFFNLLGSLSWTPALGNLKRGRLLDDDEEECITGILRCADPYLAAPFICSSLYIFGA